MKSELNRALVESLNESSNQTFIENVKNTVFSLVSSAVESVSQKTPFVLPEKCVLIPVNEICTGAVTQLSEFSFFLGIENPQIEMNTKTVKNFWKFAWREFRASWRLGRKKYKKRRKENPQPAPQTIEKYQLSNFRHDLVLCIADMLSQTSLIYEYDRHFSIVGREDFGTNVKINIYVTAFDSLESTFKLYTARRNKFCDISFGSRYENLEYKQSACGTIFNDMIKIFNTLFCKRYNAVSNQILVESLLFNCPNVLFDGSDVFKTFVNVANYIRIAAPTSFASIANTENTVFQDKLVVSTGQQTEYSKIIRMLDEFKF